MRAGAICLLGCAMLASAVHAAEAGSKKQAVDIRGSEGSTVAAIPVVPVSVVGGSVDVGNLPLDADGAMRVTCGSSPSRETQYMSLIDEPLTLPPNTTGYVTAAVETAGFSRERPVPAEVVPAGYPPGRHLLLNSSVF